MTTTKYYVSYWDRGWCEAVSPRRTLGSANIAAKRFGKRFPHLKPITVRCERISLMTVQKHR